MFKIINFVSHKNQVSITKPNVVNKFEQKKMLKQKEYMVYKYY